MKNKTNICLAVVLILFVMGGIFFYAQSRTFKQIEDLEFQQTPMIIGSTSYWKFAKEYQGKKYISYQAFHLFKRNWFGICHCKGYAVRAGGSNAATVIAIGSRLENKNWGRVIVIHSV